jgi:hypothetical protein
LADMHLKWKDFIPFFGESSPHIQWSHLD